MTFNEYSIIRMTFTICLILPCMFTSPSFSQTITLGAEDWQPYVNKSSKHYGFACRVISKAFEKVGITVEYHFTNWARAMEMAKAGTVDGTFLWYKTPEREPFFYFSKQPILKISVVFFYRKNMQFKWNTLEDTQTYRIGAPIGYHISDEFEKYEKAGLINVTRIQSDIFLLRMLIRNRIDLFPQDFFVGYNLLNNNFSADISRTITNSPKPLTERPSYLLLTKTNPKNKKIITLFNKGFSELVNNGDYDQFLDDVITRKPVSQ
ncbi:substrate-binding periplasmic protein [Zooshikella ganghwensis]|uniref:Solute-binding protein family 3/N-terminal domain-containing protein n=1 Tax=Zooshikella ganghwensis TaxID=202772 RepID=A0A4P9VI58_9GAMM|nr:transporter substrate-binding domain-containing protein [Zooshikella ganghwensis]RDH41910.1 hypothetical protein B9G39_26200 [Zooshikella ganghwensis]